MLHWEQSPGPSLSPRVWLEWPLLSVNALGSERCLHGQVDQNMAGSVIDVICISLDANIQVTRFLFFPVTPRGHLPALS